MPEDQAIRQPIHFSVQIEPEHHVAFQLFVASVSDRIIKKRRRAKIRLPIMWLILALIVSFQTLVATVFLLLVAVLWFLLYPKWEKRHYEKHYTSFVDEHYTGDIEVEIEITDDMLRTTDEGGETTLRVEMIDKIVEIGTLFFVMLASNQGLIIPKNQLQNIDEFRSWINYVSKEHGITQHVDLEWNWT